MAEGGAATALATCFWREFEHQDPPGGGGGGSSHHQTLEPQGLGKLGVGGSGGLLFTALGRGKVGKGSLPPSNLLHFFKGPQKKTSSPNTINTELSRTLGTCPSGRSGEWVNAFSKVQRKLFKRPPVPYGAKYKRNGPP